MGMLGTLGKIAMGVMVARTVGKAMGGAGGLLGGLLGGGSKDAPQSGTPKSGGGLGDLLNSFGEKDSQNSNLGNMLNDLLSGKEVNAGPSEEKKAEVLLYAMLNAAKADGKIDKEEEEKLTKHIGDASEEEIKIVKDAIESPLDVDAFVATVPEGMEEQVYIMSLAAINLDTQAEAQYLDTLREKLGISRETANLIHQKAGAPVLYS
ncbi:MAG: hypothetical protein DSZ06_02685 [Sulfurospirillum sp.]|nr:MAG: hypothetical protein DSZ06_02685 [Sulfurospirillum sp.]